MMKKFLIPALFIAGLAGANLTILPAEAGNNKAGAFAAGAAAGLVGGAIIGSQLRPQVAPAPEYVAPDCYWRRERVFDGVEYHIRRIQVCD
jgi:hypothetical protein